MRYLTTTSALEDLTGAYGLDWKAGVLSEHLHLAEANPALRLATTASGLTWVAPARGGKAVPVVCSEIVAIPTEDGPVSGRCGLFATVDGACEGHAEERAYWTELSEAERAYMERQAEGF